MVEVTKEQIEEVLERLRSYGHWAFLSPGSAEKLANSEGKWNGRKTKISISSDNLYKLELDNGQVCYYDAKISLVAPHTKGSLNNTEVFVRIADSQDLLPDDLQFCKSYIPCIFDLFRQTIMFDYLVYMDKFVENGIVDQLSKLVPLPEPIKIEKQSKTR